MILSVKNINKIFNYPTRLQVLYDISFDIAHGEFVAIMGKSGCGKSTLLYILSTMDTDYQGQLYINDQKITGMTDDELAALRNEKIGFVFQFHYLLPEFTVLENVMLPAKKLGRKTTQEIEHDANEILELLDISNLGHKKATRISGGEKQRVAIARALINKPSIIMGDEPTGNLDSKNSENVFDVFRQLSDRSNLSFLVVTHDNDFAKKTDRIIRMTDGKLVQS